MKLLEAVPEDWKMVNLKGDLSLVNKSTGMSKYVGDSIPLRNLTAKSISCSGSQIAITRLHIYMQSCLYSTGLLFIAINCNTNHNKIQINDLKGGTLYASKLRNADFVRPSILFTKKL